ncbi:MAG: hypothetical protein ACK559_25600, partial [bacterium]
MWRRLRRRRRAWRVRRGAADRLRQRGRRRDSGEASLATTPAGRVRWLRRPLARACHGRRSSRCVPRACGRGPRRRRNR